MVRIHPAPPIRQVFDSEVAQTRGAQGKQKMRNIQNRLKRKYLTLSLKVLICFALFGFGGYSLGKQFLKPLQSTKQPQASQKPVSSLSPKTPADWRTCSNTKAGFSIAYPANFEADQTTCNYTVMDYDRVKNIKTSNSADDFRKNWFLTITTERTSSDVDQWIENKCLTSSPSCSKAITGPIANSKQYDLQDVHYAETNTVVKTNGMIFNFSLNARNPNTPVNQSIRDVYNKIISTLRSPVDTQTIQLGPLEVAKKYLNAYVSKDWVTAKKLSGDNSFDENLAMSYGFTKYEITGSKPDNKQNYFHVYVKFTDQSGKVFDKAPYSTESLEVLMFKDSTGKWSALTWYFFE